MSLKGGHVVASETPTPFALRYKITGAENMRFTMRFEGIHRSERPALAVLPLTKHKPIFQVLQPGRPWISGWSWALTARCAGSANNTRLGRPWISDWS